MSPPCRRTSAIRATPPSARCSMSGRTSPPACLGVCEFTESRSDAFTAMTRSQAIVCNLQVDERLTKSPMTTDRTASQARVPTSVQLARMLDRAEEEAVVSIGWLMEQLGGRSFGLALLIMGVLGILPGISTVAALMVVWLAVQLMLGQEAGVLPCLVSRRSVGVQRLVRRARILASWLGS